MEKEEITKKKQRQRYRDQEKKIIKKLLPTFFYSVISINIKQSLTL